MTSLSHALGPNNVWAQQTGLKPGDKVEVSFLGEWYDAEVTEIVRQDFMIKATFTDSRGKTRTGRLFGKGSFRAVAQPPGDSQPVARKWISADGQHTVTATFVKLTGDTVELLKEDETRVTVARSSLSKKDNRYLDNLLGKKEGTKAEPAPERTELLATNNSFVLDDVPMIDVDVDASARFFPNIREVADRGTRPGSVWETAFRSEVQGPGV